MRRPILWLCMVAFCLTLLSIPVFAQDEGMHAPPKVLMIVREEVKPGKAAAHIMNETAWTEGFKKAHYDTPAVGMNSVTGPAESWFLAAYPSFEALEKDGEKMDKDPAIRHVNEMYGPKEADLVSEARTMTLRYQADMSYHPEVKLGEYKYFSVAIVRFRIGEDVAAFYKALNAAREKANVDTHTAVYSVSSGAPVGTYISFTPMKSMAAWDDPPNEALNAAEKETGWTDMVPKALMNVEFRLFAFSPGMSMPTKDMIAANPSFWNPKPMTAKKAEPAAPAAEKATPAAKKEVKK